MTGGPCSGGTVTAGAVLEPPVVPFGWPTLFDGPPEPG
jgi:hypothetical protein